MDISQPKTAEESGGPPDYSMKSKSGKFTPMPGVQEKPITVQELGNMYAEWRMANQFSPGTEEWMPNQTILLIPAPKRKFNWKACWILLVTVTITMIACSVILYCIKKYTSLEVTGGRISIPDHEDTTIKINYGPQIVELERRLQSGIKQAEEIRRSHEESMRIDEETRKAVERYQAMRPMIDPVKEYEELQRAREKEREDLQTEARKIIANSQKNRLPKV